MKSAMPQSIIVKQSVDSPKLVEEMDKIEADILETELDMD